MNASAPRLALLAAMMLAAGPQVMTFRSDVDDSDQPYGLYLPKDFNPRKKYPLVISLHGAGSNHRLNLRRVFGKGNRPGESDAQATRLWPTFPDVDFIVATPYARGTMGYQGVAEKDVYDVLADVKSQYPIDDDRVYLTGLSMGGGGALWLGFTRPDVWAAIAAVCPAAPAGTDELAGNALNVPVKLFQGELDPIVPVTEARRWKARLEDEGVRVEYVEYPGVRHNSWDYAYRDAAIFEWFAKHKRNRAPERVRYMTRSYKHSAAYWVTIDRLTPGEEASIDARLSGGVLVVETNGVDGFTIAQPFKTARIDGARVAVKGTSFRRTAKGWTAGVSKPAGGEKRPGLEGPIADAVSSRHAYVYGEDQQSLAKTASDWAAPRSPLLLRLPVVRDDVAPEQGHLVLFGTRETNSVIRKHAAQLPAHLNPGAADYGLLYVYPVNGRYMVISSGLPWWTRIDQAQTPGLPFIGERYRMLRSFGDFVLFKGGIDNIVVEGRFDRNWKFPPAALEKLRATQAVEVRQ